MIYLAILIFYIFLAVSFIVENKTLGLLSSTGIMLVSVYTLIYGIDYMSTTLVQAFSIISLCFGAYIFIAGSLSDIEFSGI